MNRQINVTHWPVSQIKELVRRMGWREFRVICSGDLGTFWLERVA